MGFRGSYLAHFWGNPRSVKNYQIVLGGGGIKQILKDPKIKFCIKLWNSLLGARRALSIPLQELELGEQYNLKF